MLLWSGAKKRARWMEGEEEMVSWKRRQTRGAVVRRVRRERCVRIRVRSSGVERTREAADWFLDILFLRLLLVVVLLNAHYCIGIVIWQGRIRGVGDGAPRKDD